MLMNQIMREWRTFLKESALGFGPRGLSELGDMTFSIVWDLDFDRWTVRAHDAEGYVIGDVALEPSEEGGCDNILETHSNIRNPSEASYGPFLYDLAIEFGTLMGYGVAPSEEPSGFRDMNSGSSKSYAINVWLYYLKKRTDVEKYPIDCKSMIKNRYYPLTIDNVEYKVFPDHELRHLHDGWNSDIALKNPPPIIQDKVNAINYFYKKDPILLNKLRASGRLYSKEINFYLRKK